MTTHRIAQTDFTPYVVKVDFKIGVLKPKEIPSLITLFRPWDSSVWVYALVSLAMAALTLWMTESVIGKVSGNGNGRRGRGDLAFKGRSKASVED